MPNTVRKIRRQSQTERSDAVTRNALLAPIIINQVPYKEGDVLKARVNGNPVFVRVKHISRYSYTLALNNAELSVKY